jgi:hypothetical protein
MAQTRGLSAANRAALAAVRARAERERPRDLARIASVLAGAGVEADVDALLGAAARAPLTVNFHPDRLLADGRSVARALAEQGIYRSQFETGISNGGLTAHPGGDRDRWERALFAGVYDEAPTAERPKYGGLNLLNHRNGACPRFESCHLRLRPAAAARATLIFGDSAARPSEAGLIDALHPVMAPVLESVAAQHVQAFVDGVLHGRGSAMTNTLDDYIEAQVHGSLDLARDVDAGVIDPSFAGTPDGDRLLAAAERHGFAAEWHAGLTLAPADVPRDTPDVRGEPMRWQALCGDGRAFRLAERVAAPHLDAATIGRAAVSVVRDPARWRDWGSAAEVLVHLKDLWLMLVALGRPGAVSPTA